MDENVYFMDENVYCIDENVDFMDNNVCFMDENFFLWMRNAEICSGAGPHCRLSRPSQEPVREPRQVLCGA